MHAQLRQFLSITLFLALLSGCETGLPEGEWDNPHDPTGTAYHPPILGLRDTAIRDGETGVLQSFVRPQIASLESCRWTLDGEPLESRDCSIPTRGWKDGSHVVTLVATDVRGVASPRASANVWIGNQPPRLEEIDDWRVGASATVSKTLGAQDPDGSIAEISWDTVPERYSILSDLLHLGPLPGGGSRTVHWRARDDDGAVTTSSFVVGFVAAPTPDVRMTMNSSGVLHDSKWSYTVNMSMSEVFSFDVVVYPSDDLEDALNVTASGTQGSFNCTRSRYYQDHLPWRFQCKEASGFMWGGSEITATVTNRYGERTSVSVYVNVQRISS